MSLSTLRSALPKPLSAPSGNSIVYTDVKDPNIIFELIKVRPQVNPRKFWNPRLFAGQTPPLPKNVPAHPSLNPDTLTFQLWNVTYEDVYATHTTGKYYVDRDGKRVENHEDLMVNAEGEVLNREREDREDTVSSSIIMFGNTVEGHSLCLYVEGFRPYFYMSVPHHTITDRETGEQQLVPFTDGEIDAFLGQVLPYESICLKKQQWEQKNNKPCKYACTADHHVCPYAKCMDWSYHTAFVANDGYTGHVPKQYIKVTVPLPRHVRGMRLMLEDRWGLTTYEADTAFVLRYMVDDDKTPEAWYQIPKSACVPIMDGALDPQTGDAMRLRTYCQLEAKVHMLSIVDAPSELQSMLGAKVTLGLDGEMEPYVAVLGANPQFPMSLRDSVLQLAFYYKVTGKGSVEGEDDLHGIACILKDCKSFKIHKKAKSVTVFCFEDERQMFYGIRNIVRAVDPDIMVTYNGDMFDWPYLVSRAEHLGIDGFTKLCRLRNRDTKVVADSFQSRAAGKHMLNKINFDGRDNFDLYYWMKKNKKFRSYKLDSVANEIIGLNKVELAYTRIPEYQQTADGRTLLLVYALFDVQLLFFLMAKLQMEQATATSSRLNGIMFREVLYRGMGLRGRSKLLRWGRKQPIAPYIFQTKVNRDEAKSYEGASVLEPKRGFWDFPVATLDFGSLYPSIMLERNLCITTKVSKEEIRRLNLKEHEHYTRNVKWWIDEATYEWMEAEDPLAPCFVVPEIRKGLSVQILEYLLKERKRVKGLMNAETVPWKKANYDVEQKEVKKDGNSLYGFYGADTSFAKDKDVASTVTARGRQMTNKCKWFTQKWFQRKTDPKELWQMVKQHLHFKFITARTRREVLGQCEETGELHCPFDAIVIYGDTDSIFVGMKGIGLQEAGMWAQIVSACCSAMFGKPHILEPEKIYFPLLQIAKKRYCGAMYVEDNEQYAWNPKTGITTFKLTPKGVEKFKHEWIYRNKKGAFFWTPDCSGKPIDAKYAKEEIMEADGYVPQGMSISKPMSDSGLESKRRDNCRLVANLVKDVLWMLMQDSGDNHQNRGLKQAVEHVKAKIVALNRDELDFFELICSAGMSNDIENYGGKRKREIQKYLKLEDEPYYRREDGQNDHGDEEAYLQDEEAYVTPGEGSDTEDEEDRDEKWDDALDDDDDGFYERQRMAKSEQRKTTSSAASGGNGADVEMADDFMQMGGFSMSSIKSGGGGVNDDDQYVTVEGRDTGAHQHGVPMHVVLAKRLIERLGVDLGPKTGDRISYVVVDKGKRIKISECGEDPLYAWEHELPINKAYYLVQIRKVLTRIFAPIFAPECDMTDKPQAKRAQAIVDEKLFEGPHMKSISVSVSKKSVAGPLSKLLTFKSRCQRCNASSVEDGMPLCKSCAKYHSQEYLADALDQLSLAEEQSMSLWENCQACMGLNFQGTRVAEEEKNENDMDIDVEDAEYDPPQDTADVIVCENQGCNFYWKRRLKARDASKAREKVVKYDNLEF